MSKIKIVVEISQEVYEHAKNNSEDSTDEYNAMRAIANGTPLPKGHWIRVDKNKVRCSECEIIHLIAQYPNGKIDWCPNCGADMRLIIEADKAESEE